MAKYLSIANKDLQWDSQLVVVQLRGEYEAKNKRMEQYLQIGKALMASLKRIEVMHIPMTENQMADALANLATIALHPCNVEISIMDQPSIQGTTVMAIDQQAGPSWMMPIAEYLSHGTLLENKAKAVKVKA